jgi:DNA-binding LytR/AlgR family response regulator
MKALIIEDELPAQRNLQRNIENLFNDITIVGCLDSVQKSIEWLKDGNNLADIIFMDVELSDGMCFEIFDHVTVNAKVVITTAFNDYAIKAFKVNSIDYLLKPVDPAELSAAVERCRKAMSERQKNIDPAALQAALTGTKYKSRFIIRIGERIIILDTEDIAYFYSEEKSTFTVSKDGQRYLLDMSLDAIQEVIDPSIFFRISRSCIVSIKSIAKIDRFDVSKLRITLMPESSFEAFVSRIRIGDFMSWLEK